MTKRERAIVAACADTMFPPGGAIPISGTDAGLVAYVDGYLRPLAFVQRVLIRLLLLFIQLSPLVFGPRHARFTKLTPHERDMVLRDMEKSGMYFRRIALQSIRMILTLGYCAHHEVQEYIRPQKEVPS